MNRREGKEGTEDVVDEEERESERKEEREREGRERHFLVLRFMFITITIP